MAGCSWRRLAAAATSVSRLKDGRGGVNFRGTRRTNDTHAADTDPEAKSARKGAGNEAKPCFGGHALMENRNGLCVDIRVSSALETETTAATELLRRQRRKRLKPLSLGADKGYHSKAFVALLRRHGIRPHIAQIEARRTPGLDARTTRHASYAVSQRKRKRVEEIVGWMNSFGGQRRSTRFKGIARVQLHAHFVDAAYNLLRMSRLRPLTGYSVCAVRPWPLAVLHQTARAERSADPGCW